MKKTQGKHNKNSPLSHVFPKWLPTCAYFEKGHVKYKGTGTGLMDVEVKSNII
jgi:hypothetical protein